MKIGLISDTHGDLEAWNKALKVFLREKISLILHAGDILYHGVFNPVKKTYDPLELAGAINNSPIPIIFAKGNCDSVVDTMAIEYPIQSPFAFYVESGKQIMLLHGDKYDEKELMRIGKKYQIDFIVRGHSHSYKITQGKPAIINPGSCSLSKSQDGIPTAAILKDNSVDIFNLETGLVLESVNF